MLSRLKQKQQQQRVPSVSLSESLDEDEARGRAMTLNANGNVNGKRRSASRSSFNGDSPSKGPLLVPIRSNEPSDNESDDQPGQGSLTLDHLDAVTPVSPFASASNMAPGGRTPVVQAPELMLDTALSSSHPDDNAQTPVADDSRGFTLTSNPSTPAKPLPPQSANSSQLLSPPTSSGRSRSRSNTMEKGPSQQDLSGIQALAAINKSRSSNDLSSTNGQSGSDSRPHSRPVSRSNSPTRKRGLTASSEPGIVDDSPASKKLSSLTIPVSPALKKSRSSSGIASAIAASGVALATTPNSALRQPLASAKFGRDSIDDDNKSDYDGMDGFSDFDDVVSMLGTGYAVASSKRNAEFHNIFKDIPEDDYLIEDYGCALQRDILVQGRLYISEHHLCFNANIFGWVTSLVLPFAEVVSIEKRMTAYVIPNAIQVITLHSRYTFASFLSRDTTYDLICNIWKMVHPGIPASAALPDSTSRTDLSMSSQQRNSDDDAQPVTPSGDLLDHDGGEPAQSSKGVKKRLLGRRKRGDTATSENSASGAAPAKEQGSSGELVAGNHVKGSSGTTAHAHGHRHASHVKVHRETTDTCPILANLKEVALDAVFPSTPEKIYNLMFTSGFMKDFWQDNQKLTDIEMSDWKPEKTGSHLLARSMTYVKQLNNSIGPKQTKCHITDENAHVDFDDFVCVITTTRTPDVPSGSAFAVKTRTSLTWAKGNSCRVRVTTGVEWSKSSFIKGIIERSCMEGQKAYHSDLEKAMRVYIQQHESEFVSEGQDATESSEILNNSVAAEHSANHLGEDQAREGSGDGEDADANKARKRANAQSNALTGALEGLLELAQSTSATNMALFILIVALVLSNVWTLASKAPTHPSASSRLGGNAPAFAGPSSHLGNSRTPDEVAMAVRGVLQDYFSASTSGNAEAAIDAPGASAQEEVQRITVALDELEKRIVLLRKSLNDVE